jgi:hypothetical protein
MIQLVVFDMAGTTVDEQNVVYKTVHQAILRGGFDVSLDTVLWYGAGKEKFQAIKDVLAHLQNGVVDEQTAKAIHKDFEQLLDAAYAVLQPIPMPGAEHVFAELRARGIKVVLNTGYKRTVAEFLLHRLKWTVGTTVDMLYTADDIAMGRPHPDMIQAAMAAVGVTDAKNVAKIGDSVIDIEEGKNAGCGIAAGITTGAQSEEQLRLAEPTHILHGLEEVLALV